MTTQCQKELAELLARIEFPPYDLVVRFPDGNEKTYAIKNQKDETQAIEELEQWVNQNFQSVIITKGIYSEDLCQKLKGQYARVRSVFADRFHLHQDEFSGRECLGAKPIIEEDLGNGLKRVVHANAIEEISHFSEGKWEIKSRHYRNGEFEEGHFGQDGTILRGTRFVNGEYEFFGPDYIGHNEILFQGRFYVFAIIKIKEEKQLALLERNGRFYQISK
ncbi:MAG TPA: hypothetical protein DCE71_04405, partial [Parachlamydiales bacterium]|nr:hypothetical protein [Parachlamydiales bacterium]